MVDYLVDLGSTCSDSGRWSWFFPDDYPLVSPGIIFDCLTLPLTLYIFVFERFLDCYFIEVVRIWLQICNDQIWML